MRKNCFIFSLLLLPWLGVSQSAAPAKQFPKIHIPRDAQNTTRLQEINRDIWAPFSEAYAGYDAEKYLGLHTPDFIRANGGKQPAVRNLAGYRENVAGGFERGKTSKRRAEIAFSFFERVAGENLASERGIYRYTAIAQDSSRQHFYGKFHVFHRKVDGRWKIAVDYDSDEDGSIGVADFEAGVAPDFFDCMARAIALDDSLGIVRNHACKAISLSETIRQYAEGIGQITRMGCPTAFTEGFQKHREAWLALVSVTDQYPDLRGEMHTLFKQLEAGSHAGQFKPLVKAVWDTWGEIEAAMEE